MGLGGNSSTTAGAVSMFLDLHGPALTINTACSSSLVALHLAIQSLQRGECSPYAIVVGVNILLDREMHQHLASVGILSSMGKCQPFRSLVDGHHLKNRDEEGTVRGDGVCVLILSLETDHKKGSIDRSPHALIETTGVNCDGRSTLLTAPNPLAQRMVFRDCLLRSMSIEKNYAFDQQQKPYVQAIEMHGTGTQLGDPIELRSALSVYGSPSFPIHIGSIKSNFGHTESAAGLAGVLKMIISLKKRAFLPMSYTQNDYQERLSDLPSFSSFSSGLFSIPKEVQAWDVEAGEVRRGAVSSFGFTGTNAHCILREAPLSSSQQESEKDGGYMRFEKMVFALVLSAKSTISLRKLKKSYLKKIKKYLKSNEVSLSCFSSPASSSVFLPSSSSSSSSSSSVTAIPQSLHPLQSLCIRSALFRTHNPNETSSCHNLGWFNELSTDRFEPP